ncbi:MAG: hypothetical protein ACI89T_001690 [Cognaticolwellia sp.]|jgi:hypothetical protein
MLTSVRIVTTLLLLVSSSSCLATTHQDLDDELSQRCLDTLDFIKSQDLAAFMAQMPPEHVKGQEKRLERILARSHERWFVRGQIKSLDLIAVTYKEASKDKQERFDAIELAKVQVSIIGTTFNSPRVSCKYIRNPQGWFLSKIP